MAARDHHRRVPWIAVVAILGMLCVADAASACSKGGQTVPQPAACRMEREPAGCCCSAPAPASEVIPPGAERVPPSATLPVAEPCHSCVCPAEESVPPASRSESRLPEGRPHGSSLPSSLNSAILAADHPGAASRPAPSDTAGSPRVPIYLRTLHLLN
jgi:hypothetical protein